MMIMIKCEALVTGESETPQVTGDGKDYVLERGKREKKNDFQTER